MSERKNLKARPKAGPTRLQASLQNPLLIRGQRVETNDYVHISEADLSSIADLPEGNISVPLEFWQEHKQSLMERESDVGVQIAADQFAEDVLDDLNNIKTIVITFVSHADGRGYTHAYLLKTRYGFEGEIRAVGDVNFDQLDFLARTGFDAFEIAESEKTEDALAALEEFSHVYQPSADDESLIFAQRR